MRGILGHLARGLAPLVLAMSILLTLPSLSADPLGASGVSYYPAGPSAVSLHLGEQLTYPWVFYNGAVDSVYVNVTGDGSNLGVTTVTSRPFLILGPAEWGQVDVELRAPLDGPRRSGSLVVHLTAVDLATSAVFTQDAQIPVTIFGVSPADDPTGKVIGIWPNPLPPPFDNVWGAFGVSVAGWAVVGLVLVFVVDPVAKGLAKRTTTRADDIAIRILRGPVFLLIVLYGTVNSLGILGLPSSWHRLLLSGSGFALVLVLTWVAYRVFRSILVEYGRHVAKRTRSDIDTRLVPGLEKLGGVVIVILGLVLAVQSLGYDITLFLAGLGVIGLIVAFAAQDTLSNLFAGIHLMLDRPFRIGDMIELDDGTVCRVQDIGLRSTKLYWGKSHDIIIMPNKEMAGRKIINYMRPDRRFVMNIKVGVSYDSDLDRVRAVMTEVAKAHPWVIKDSGFEPIWRVIDFAESAIVVMIIVGIDDVDHQWQLGSDLREQIKKRFDAEGIEIPFPRRVVEVRGNSPAP